MQILKTYLRNKILAFLKLEDIPQRVNKLEQKTEDLSQLRDKLTDKLMEGRPQLRHTLHLLQQDQYTKTEIVQELEDTFEISQATAYRRINELEEELQYIEKTEKGYKALVDIE